MSEYEDQSEIDHYEAAAEASAQEYHESLHREKIEHAIDHVLSNLDILDWELEDHVADVIRDAIGQLQHIKKELL
jgi:hypothetical protein